MVNCLRGELLMLAPWQEPEFIGLSSPRTMSVWILAGQSNTEISQKLLHSHEI